MADAVTVNTIINTKTHIVVHMTNISDGTGESNVIKVDKSTLLALDGAEPNSLDIDKVRWNVQGFKSVRLSWDHTTDDVAMVLSGSGFENFSGEEGDLPGFVNAGSLKDPRSSGGAGDILLTTDGTTSGNTYDITLWLRKNHV